MRIQTLYTFIAPLTSYLRLTTAQAQHINPLPGANGTNQAIFAGIRSASTMAIDDSQMNGASRLTTLIRPTCPSPCSVKAYKAIAYIQS
jgi:hypothetical protein